MGQEINTITFTEKDFSSFNSALIHETEILEDWLKNDKFCNDKFMGGFEIESWILDSSLRPAPVNKEFLEKFKNPLVVPELALFNLEFNNIPHLLEKNFLSIIHSEINTLWLQAQLTAKQLQNPSSLLLIGTLPTLSISDLNENSMSDMKRYHALNTQIMKSRDNKPVHINIKGEDQLEIGNDNVMLEATTTSFQIHTQVPANQAHHYYNSAQIISAPIIAISSNSPFVLGKNLWSETRIPLFEQSIDTANPDAPIKRVSFGKDFLKDSIFECFSENLDNFYILLPTEYKNSKTLKNLRLHNGTIWRWNRPLIGFNENNQPHLRIEHRVMPAGPTIIDMMANAAFYYGLSHYWAQSLLNGYPLPDYNEVNKNFYTAAKYGVHHSLEWYGKTIQPVKLINDILLPQAKEGLKNLDITEDDIEKYISIISARAETKQTGADWQRNYVKKHKCDMHELTHVYKELQNKGSPVHTWDY
jgi:hypothetical protein